ncbi:hypothetical protein [Nostoc commune]|uniref:hypothetical protein n=1 Tax=Nostoc commune TaxID=1178 RepID=UPI0018C49623|nr:hypothetical protein [Nostoc commune]MBG1262890.1 hypothetical protein [Nostoc commune BAE]
MTHIIYSHQQLQLKSIARLKQIYSEIACTVEVSDKRCKDAWITAIAEYQSSKVHKIADNQTTAQTELDSYITAQAQAVAPEEFTPVEISFDHHEYYALDRLIASITYDDDHLTQRWVVMVEGVEQFRANTWARCHRFIQWHHKQGTLNTQVIPQVQELTFLEISYYDQEVHIGDYHTDSYLVASISFDHDNYEDLYWRVMINAQEIYRDITPALCYEYIKQQYYQGTFPVQEQLPKEAEGLLALSKGEEISPLHPAPCSLSSSTTGNEVMAHIFNECEKYGFEILDDGIYHNDVKLGKVGCTDGNWWVIQGCSAQQQYSNSVFDAVRSLSMADTSPATEYLQSRPLEQLTTEELQQLLDAEVDNCEQLLDRPVDELTPQDWERLREYEPYLELVAA